MRVTAWQAHAIRLEVSRPRIVDWTNGSSLRLQTGKARLSKPDHSFIVTLLPLFQAPAQHSEIDQVVAFAVRSPQTFARRSIRRWRVRSCMAVFRKTRGHVVLPRRPSSVSISLYVLGNAVLRCFSRLFGGLATGLAVLLIGGTGIGIVMEARKEDADGPTFSHLGLAWRTPVTGKYAKANEEPLRVSSSALICYATTFPFLPYRPVSPFLPHSLPDDHPSLPQTPFAPCRGLA